jgi:hypothetical protein
VRRQYAVAELIPSIGGAGGGGGLGFCWGGGAGAACALRGGSYHWVFALVNLILTKRQAPVCQERRRKTQRKAQRKTSPSRIVVKQPDISLILPPEVSLRALQFEEPPSPKVTHRHRAPALRRCCRALRPPASLVPAPSVRSAGCPVQVLYFLPVAWVVRFVCWRLYSAVPYIRGAPFQVPTLDHSTNTRSTIQPTHTRHPGPRGSKAASLPAFLGERQLATGVVCIHPSAWRTHSLVQVFGRSHPPPTQSIGLFSSPAPSVSSRGEYPGEDISGHPRDQVESAVPGCGKVVGTSSVPLARESHPRRDASLRLLAW